MHPSCTKKDCLSVSPGQPFRLQLMKYFSSACDDPEVALPDLLHAGVPTGIFDDLPTSMQWVQRQKGLADDSLDDLQLEHCEGNWSVATQQPPLLDTLLDKELKAGHVRPFQGSREDARKKWPLGTAAGKLHIAIAEGKDPRLVLDSTICNANRQCRIPEQVSMPTALDVQRTFASTDMHACWQDLFLDVKAAQVR